MPDLLIELFSEDIPARMQRRAADDLKRLMTDGLVEAGLTYAGAAGFATPRRLALAVQGLSGESPTLREERRGPRVDAPEKAIEGFLRATGLPMEALERREEKKGAVYIATLTRPGRPADAIVAEVLARVIREFPWPKSMRWGAGSLRWVRPLHSILCLLTDEAGARVVEMEVDGIRAGNTTRGHRFMAPDAFAVTGFDDYRAKLQRAFVRLDAEDRAAHIRADAEAAAFAKGLELVPDAGLLEEVAGLVEWPMVLMGEIAPAFLDLPAEVLQTSMRTHQKFFSLRDPSSARIVGFVTVANRETADAGATILAGNAKVLSARLSDAKFFWENDLRLVADKGLEGMAAGLANVTFHNKLGSQKARIDRISALAREIAPLVGADPDQAAQAAQIAKADLQSAMVGEFPELQGIMGSHYARAAGLPEAVAAACREHYQPLGPSDAVPTGPVSVAVALADKIDTLTGFWAIDEKPTGSKDPYALRRAALGVIRLVLGNGVRLELNRHIYGSITWHAQSAKARLGLEWLSDDDVREAASIWNREPASAESLSAAIDTFLKAEDAGEKLQAMMAVPETVVALEELRMTLPGLVEPQNTIPSLLSFFHDRLKVHLRDQGIRHDVIDACLAMPGNDDLTLLVKRAEALAGFLKTEDGANLVQGFRRANNILTQAEERDGVEYSFGPDAKLAQGAEEAALFTALDAAEAAIDPAMAAEDFAAAMGAMAALRAPIDAFFEAVQINTDNQIIRRNRLNLLHRIRAICLSVADLRRIEGQG